MTSLQSFGNNLVKISPNNNKMDIFIIYTERAVEKCPRWNFQTPWKPRNSKNKSVNSFAGHPVLDLVEHYIPNFQRMNRNQKFDILIRGIYIDNPEIISTNIILTKAVQTYIISSKRFP